MAGVKKRVTRAKKAVKKAVTPKEPVQEVGRNEPESCENCKYRMGSECRYGPPTVLTNSIGRVSGSVWPVVELSGWCGKWTV